MSTMKNWLPTLLFIILLGVVTVGAVSYFAFNNTGNIVVTVEVDAFKDAGLTIPLESIDWGAFQPEENKTTMVWLNSTSNVPVKLNMTTTGWTPTNATDYVTLTWDREGTTINPSQTLNATLTLTVDNITSNVTSFDFTFTTNINAEEP